MVEVVLLFLLGLNYISIGFPTRDTLIVSSITTGDKKRPGVTKAKGSVPYPSGTIPGEGGRGKGNYLGIWQIDPNSITYLMG